MSSISLNIPISLKTSDLSNPFVQGVGPTLFSYGFTPPIRNRLLGLLLTENIDIQAAKRMLIETASDPQTQALALQLARNSERDLSEFMSLPSLKNACTPSAPEREEDWSKVIIPRTFIKLLEDHIETNTKIIDEIITARRTEPGRAILDLIRTIVPLEAKPNRQDTISELYKIVKDIANSGRTIVSHKDFLALHLLTYLPDECRYPIQDLLVRGTYLSFCKQLKSKLADPAHVHFADLMIEQIHCEIFSNKHWDKILKDIHAPVEIIDEISVLAHRRTAILTEILDRTIKDLRTNVFCPSFKFREHVYQCMVELDSSYGARLWQSIDVGHCFSGICYLEEAAFKKGLSVQDRQKNGLYAVILEDDPDQAKNYFKLIDLYSPFTIMPAGQCDTLAALYPISKQEGIGYFLLDIDNHGDMTAGVRAAIQIVEQKLASHAAGRLSHQIQIVVWTNSPLLLEQAKESLHDYLVLTSKDALINSDLLRSSDNLISIKFKLKSEKLF